MYPRGTMMQSLVFAVVMIMVLASGVVVAGDDHVRARQALEAGEVMPLRQLLQQIAVSHPGEIIDVELEQREGRWLYEIKMLRRGGGMFKLKVDARDGEVIEVRGRGHRMRCRESGGSDCMREPRR